MECQQWRDDVDQEDQEYDEVDIHQECPKQGEIRSAECELERLAERDKRKEDNKSQQSGVHIPEYDADWSIQTRTDVVIRRTHLVKDAIIKEAKRTDLTHPS